MLLLQVLALAVAPQATNLPAGVSTLIWPVRSESYLTPRGGDAAATTALAGDDLALSCRRLSFSLGGMVSFPEHRSDIPELDSPSNVMARSPVKGLSCGTADTTTAPDGFTQAAATLAVEVDAKVLSPEDAERHLYEVTAPVTVAAGWGSFDQGKDAYEAACLGLRANIGSSSTLYAYCEQPKVGVQCCGNASVTGAFHALVFAYEAPVWEEKVLTGPTPLDANAQAHSHLAAQQAALKSDAALAFCTPASFEYAPVMAYQARCYTLKQTFKPNFTEHLRCEAKTADGGIWVRLLERDGGLSLDWTQKTSRMTQSNSSAATIAEGRDSIAGGDGTLLAAPGIDLGSLGGDPIGASAPFDATLTGLDKYRGPASVVVSCTFK
jgi:hypothetical protein